MYEYGYITSINKNINIYIDTHIKMNIYRYKPFSNKQVAQALARTVFVKTSCEKDWINNVILDKRAALDETAISDET